MKKWMVGKKKKKSGWNFQLTKKLRKNIHIANENPRHEADPPPPISSISAFSGDSAF